MDLTGVGSCWGIKAVKGRNIDMRTLATSMSQCSDKDICRSSVVCWDGSLNMIICVSAQLCPALWWPHGLQASRLLCSRIFQARILELVVIFYSRGSSRPKGRNPRLLHLLYWQADSLPLSHLGSPNMRISHSK